MHTNTCMGTHAHACTHACAHNLCMCANKHAGWRINMRMHTHARAHTCMRTHICMFMGSTRKGFHGNATRARTWNMRVRPHTCVRLCAAHMFGNTPTCAGACMHACMHACMRMRTHACIYARTYMPTCASPHIHTHAHGYM